MTVLEDSPIVVNCAPEFLPDGSGQESEGFLHGFINDESGSAGGNVVLPLGCVAGIATGLVLMRHYGPRLQAPGSTNVCLDVQGQPQACTTQPAEPFHRERSDVEGAVSGLALLVLSAAVLVARFDSLRHHRR